jgi:hypothetical protein
MKNQFTSNSLLNIKLAMERSPEPIEVKHNNKAWISYGVQNDYPDYLINLYERSAKHNAIVTGKVKFIKGNGLSIKDVYTVSQKAEILKWLEDLNEYDTVDDLLDKVVSDIELFGGCYMECIPNFQKTKVVRINHIPFQKIRVSKDKKYLLYSEDWTKYRQTPEETGFKVLGKYDNLTKSGVYWYYEYRAGIKCYPKPEYIGCIPYIECDYEISNWHLSNIKNGFSAGTLLSFNNGQPKIEEQQIIEKKVKDKFTGSDKAGQLLITFSNSKDSAPTIESLRPNDFDKSFLLLNETVQQEIFTGHKITSLGIFGIKEPNGLGSKDEQASAYSLLQNVYITPKQSRVERIFNEIAKDSGFGNPFYIVPTKPVTLLSSENIISVMTTEEIRKEAGLKNQVQMSACKHGPADHFKNIGYPKSEYKIYKKRSIQNREEVAMSEMAFYRMKFAETNLQRSILDLIDNNNLLTPEEIAKALNKTTSQITEAINTLIEKNLLTSDLKITDLGNESIAENPTPASNLEILYSYEVRPNVGDEIIEGTRDFCRELIEADKLYTRQDIERISEKEGRDVWATRGGWYHNPNTDRTVPYCRHEWVQNVVKRK